MNKSSAIIRALPDCAGVGDSHANREERALHTSIIDSLRRLLRVYAFDAFFDEAAQLACGIAQADGAGLLLHENEQLSYRFFWGATQQFQHLQGYTFPDELGTAGAAVQQNKPVYVPDYPHSDLAMPDFVAAGLRGSLAIPLPGAEGIQGVLAISWFQYDPPERIAQPCWEYLRLLGDLLGAYRYRETLEIRMHNLATRDLLTGLPNRRVAVSRIKTEMARAVRHQHLFALLFLDLDGFKAINDQLGHEEGDLCLQAVGKDLQAVLRPEDVVIRYAGDEFLVLVADIRHSRESTEVADRLVNTVQRTIAKSGVSLPLTASVGLTVYPLDDAHPEGLIQHADQAMYLAKNAGGNRFALFTDAPDTPLFAQQHLLLDLGRALLRQ